MPQRIVPFKMISLDSLDSVLFKKDFLLSFFKSKAVFLLANKLASAVLAKYKFLIKLLKKLYSDMGNKKKPKKMSTASFKPPRSPSKSKKV